MATSIHEERNCSTVGRHLDEVIKPAPPEGLADNAWSTTELAVRRRDPFFAVAVYFFRVAKKI